MTTSAEVGRIFRAWANRGSSFDPRRPNNFDMLRFAAATLVLVDHSFVLTGRAGHAGPFGYETPAGFAVAVFFIISGFLVAGSWERAPRFLAFAVKRALRIVPAYAAVIAASALALGALVTQLSLNQYFLDPQTWAYFYNLSFVDLYFVLPGVFGGNPYANVVNGSMWTLPIELAMYISLPVLAWFGLVTRGGITILVTALAVAWFGWESALLAAPPLLMIDSLVAGASVHLALWFFLGSVYWVWRDRIRYRSDVAVALLAMLWGMQGTPAGMILLHAAIPYVVIWVAQLEVRWMHRFGRHGDFSYGIYLYAFPVAQTLTWYGGRSWPHLAYIVACFGLTLILAVMSWKLIEHPALRLKKREAVVGSTPERERPDSPPTPRGRMTVE